MLKTVFTFWIWFRDMLSNSLCLGVKENLYKNYLLQIWAVLGTRDHFDWRRVFWKRGILVLKQVHFSESIISKIFEPSSWSFFSKSAKFHTDLKNAIKISEIGFGFSDNSVWAVSGNFSQVWGEYMWSTVNVLTKSLYILDLIQRDVFQLNFSWIKGKFG